MQVTEGLWFTPEPIPPGPVDALGRLWVGICRRPSELASFLRLPSTSGEYYHLMCRPKKRPVTTITVPKKPGMVFYFSRVMI